MNLVTSRIQRKYKPAFPPVQSEAFSKQCHLQSGQWSPAQLPFVSQRFIHSPHTFSTQIIKKVYNNNNEICVIQAEHAPGAANNSNNNRRRRTQYIAATSRHQQYKPVQPNAPGEKSRKNIKKNTGKEVKVMPSLKLKNQPSQGSWQPIPAQTLSLMRRVMSYSHFFFFFVFLLCFAKLTPLAVDRPHLAILIHLEKEIIMRNNGGVLTGLYEEL